MSAADDPAASLRNLQLGDRLTQNEQYLKNLDAAQGRLELEEGALASSVDLLQRVRELAVQALNATLGPGDLKSIEVEVRSHLDGLLSLANTQNANGEFLFAGYQVDTIPFSSDGSGNFTYNGDQGQQHLQVSQTRQLAAADNGADIFQGVNAAAGGITSSFDILNDFADALAAGTVTADTLTDIDTAMDKILVVRADVGSRLRAVDDQRAPMNLSSSFWRKNGQTWSIWIIPRQYHDLTSSYSPCRHLNRYLQKSRVCPCLIILVSETGCT